MQMKRKIFIVLCIYLSQIFFVPVIHCLSEGHEKDCEDCYAGTLLSSPCDEHGPCDNPIHHHHNGHRHDPAHCAFCKSFIKDIEYAPNYYAIVFGSLILVTNSRTLHQSSTLLRRIPIRGPPLKNFLT